MKKIKYFVALASVLTLTMSTIAMADATKIEAESLPDDKKSNLSNWVQQDKGDAGVIGLKSTDDQVAVVGTLTFDLADITAGKYKVAVRYNGKGARAASLTVNDAVVSDDFVTVEHADYETYEIYEAEVNLKAGANVIVISGVIGTKAPNIDYITYELLEADENVTTTEQQEETTPKEEEPPKTGDTGLLLPVVLVAGATLVVAVAMKKKIA